MRKACQIKPHSCQMLPFDSWQFISIQLNTSAILWHKFMQNIFRLIISSFLITTAFIIYNKQVQRCVFIDNFVLYYNLVQVNIFSFYLISLLLYYSSRQIGHMKGQESSLQASLRQFQVEQNVLFTEISSFILPENQPNFIQLSYSQEGLRNLSTKRQFIKDQIILQVPFSKTVGQGKIVESRLSQYMHWLHKNQTKIRHWMILGEYQSDIYIKQLITQNSTFHLLPQIYLFESKFIQKYQQIQTPQPRQKTWLFQYLDILPHDYGLIPYRFISLIRHYHPEIANSLAIFRQSLHKAYNILKQIIFGKNMEPQWSFQSFLSISIKDYQYYHQKYCEQFSFDNFEWAYFSWKTRAFDRPSYYGPTTTYVPIIDLINHSKFDQNAEWLFIESEQRVIVRALRNINAGEELFISYGERSIQCSFEDYGFVSEEQYCCFNFEKPEQNFSGGFQVNVDCGLQRQQLKCSFQKQIKQYFCSNWKGNMQRYRYTLYEITCEMINNKQQMLLKAKSDNLQANLSREERQILAQIVKILQKQLISLKFLIQIIYQ